MKLCIPMCVSTVIEEVSDKFKTRETKRGVVNAIHIH